MQTLAPTAYEQQMNAEEIYVLAIAPIVQHNSPILLIVIQNVLLTLGFYFCFSVRIIWGFFW